MNDKTERKRLTRKDWIWLKKVFRSSEALSCYLKAFREDNPGKYISMQDARKDIEKAIQSMEDTYDFLPDD